MARLKIRLRGQIILELPLSEDRQYLAGRKEGCDIVLNESQSISREHFKLSFEGGLWTVKVISRFGDIFYHGNKIQETTLEHGARFSVDVYDFEFLMTSLDANHAVSSQESTQNISGEAIDNDKTIVGVAPSVPYLKITNSQNETKAMIRLESGESWIAGRESTAQIHIDDARVSRKQFELRKKGTLFFIVDLGSVNGTFLNGNPIPTQEAVLLKSGDAISVLDNNFYFELHDPHFQSRLELVKALPPVTTNYDMANYNQNTTEPSNYGIEAFSTQNQSMGESEMPPPTPHWQGMQKNESAGLSKFDFKKHKVRVILGGVALIAIIFAFSNSDNSSSKPKNAGAYADPMSKLTPEQQGLVKQSYQLAKNYYMQGRYESARGEISKIKEFVPQYLDSENINKLVEQAIYIQQETVKNERLEKERQEREQKITDITDKCRKKLNPKITSDEMDECLSPAVQEDPTHSKIVALKSEVEKIISDRAAQEVQRKQYLALVNQLKSYYEKAENLEKTEAGLLETLAAYQKVVKSPLPDPTKLKAKAERAIASIKVDISKKSEQFLKDADKNYEQKKMKEAIFSLRKAQRIDPTNLELQSRIDQYMAELKKQMMLLYQEGILEESFGNVDGGENKSGAKEKWKKIIELDVPDGDYYKKASIKLKKYGAF